MRRCGNFLTDYLGKIYYRYQPMTIRHLLLMLMLVLLPAACGGPSQEQAPVVPLGSAPAKVQTSGPASPPPGKTAGPERGCLACHAYEIEVHPGLSCTACHAGNHLATTRAQAHAGLIAAPGDPLHLSAKCGPCHPRETSAIAQSRHFTLSGEINPVRRHFGATRDLAAARAIPRPEQPDTPLALADDLLRRRCLRCHVYYRGDDYGATRRGTGCGACHLEYRDGQLVSHRFLAAPGDGQCLACHYGNRVGADYYGYFEHDLRDEYRTPFQSDGSQPARPRGVEGHRLQPDVHQRAGLTCRDCHAGLHRGSATTITCAACHFWRPGQPLPGAGREAYGGKLRFRGQAGEKIYTVPPARDPAHARYGAKADCAVCHAQWGFNDRGTHLLRTEVEDYQEWDDLIIQGSSEVETQLQNSLSGQQEIPPGMTDKFTGQSRPGLWLKTFATRRWESPLIGRDSMGQLRVMRPSLDLHLSWLDEQGVVRFDAVAGTGDTLRPYTPHTIGKAGAFYQQRLRETPPAEKPEAPAK
jgi:hypothetical protein